MRFTKTIASASVAAVLGLAGVSVAGATSGSSSPLPASTTVSTTAPAASSNAASPKKSHAAARKLIRRRVGALVAKTIGITRADLRTELLAGKTIAAIATEHGVQPQTVITALENAADARIDAALAAGKIKAPRAARLKARVDTVVPKIVNDWHPKHAPKG
jgi:hypothetical protein